MTTVVRASIFLYETMKRARILSRCDGCFQKRVKL